MIFPRLRKYYIQQFFHIIDSFQGYNERCVSILKYLQQQSGFLSSKMLLLSFFPKYDRKQNSTPNRSMKRSSKILRDNSFYSLSNLHPPLFSSRIYGQYRYRCCRPTIKSLNRMRSNKWLRIRILFLIIGCTMLSLR
jgi:hypothetical protein